MGQESVLADSGQVGDITAGLAGEKSGLFEHPAWYSPVVPDVQISDVFACLQSFSAAC